MLMTDTTRAVYKDKFFKGTKINGVSVDNQLYICHGMGQEVQIQGIVLCGGGSMFIDKELAGPLLL